MFFEKFVADKQPEKYQHEEPSATQSGASRIENRKTAKESSKDKLQNNRQKIL